MLEREREREREKMEAQAVFGRASPPCLSSSLLSSQTQRTSCSLSYTHCPIQRTKHHLHLAAFHSKSHLFSYSPSRPHAKTLSHKTHIFLPHLVAAMVCFSPSFFSTFYLNYRKPIWVFSHFIRYLQSLLETHLKILYLFFCCLSRCHCVCRNKLKRLI